VLSVIILDGVVESAVESNGLDEFIDSYRGLENSLYVFQRRKPNPHYINQVLDELGAESGYYAGDRVTDVQAAHNAGLEAVYVGEEPSESAEHAIEHIRGLKEILG
jgi:phosphoglycolate phosphatase-like HAD superfamily hydrolase